MESTGVRPSSEAETPRRDPETTVLQAVSPVIHRALQRPLPGRRPNSHLTRLGVGGCITLALDLVRSLDP